MAEVIAHYRSRNSNFRWKTSAATRPAGLGKALVHNGMILKDMLYGFCVEPSEMEPRGSDEAIEVFPLTAERLEDWLVVQARGWNVPPPGIEYLRKTAAEMFVPSAATKHYIAYWKGQPAGAASFRLNSDYALMIGGAVIEEFRGKGLYRALIDARFQALRTAGLPAVFHCVSTTSAPICIKLGFQKLCEIESYELPA